MQIHNTAGKPIFAWTDGVPVEDAALEQAKNIAALPFIHKHVALMPDVHHGKGATVGSVIATKGAIIPAAVGVDIGCGMMAVRTNIRESDLPDNVAAIRSDIEAVVPHGRSVGEHNRYDPSNDRGIFQDDVVLDENMRLFATEHLPVLQEILEKHPKLTRAANGAYKHLGTLGTGNHFIELCFDKQGFVWVMLHSGSRGIGNAIGTHFIELAKEDMRRYHINLPDTDLAYLPQGTQHFNDYRQAVAWAQKFARANREVMMTAVLGVLKTHFPFVETLEQAINCHHNYINEEKHFGEKVFVTRKGAVRAQEGDLGIIPGSMGARSFIVRGKGNPQSFCSCSHGAGRKMSRTKARKEITLEQHLKDTAGVECRKDDSVIDESPAAYKDIDAVMAAQSDLIEIVYELKQFLCVKG